MGSRTVGSAFGATGVVSSTGKFSFSVVEVPLTVPAYVRSIGLSFFGGYRDLYGASEAPTQGPEAAATHLALIDFRSFWSVCREPELSWGLQSHFCGRDRHYFHISHALRHEHHNYRPVAHVPVTVAPTLRTVFLFFYPLCLVGENVCCAIFLVSCWPAVGRRFFVCGCETLGDGVDERTISRLCFCGSDVPTDSPSSPGAGGDVKMLKDMTNGQEQNVMLATKLGPEFPKHLTRR